MTFLVFTIYRAKNRSGTVSKTAFVTVSLDGDGAAYPITICNL
jgi:hypothetical protein